MPTITTKDGTEIFYKDWGSGQPIVFSHGWPLSADDWDAQLLFFLHHGYRVIAHDRRGHGRSTQTADGHDMDHWTNPLRGSGAASAAMASRGKARHSGRAWCQHARNRIVRQSLSATLVDRLSQPRVAADTQRCLQRFDSAADLKQTKPILARSTPYPHWLYPPHRVFHHSAGRHWPTFTTIAPWINSTAPASASRGDRLG